MNTSNAVEISAEITPNPNTLKFNVNKTLLKSGSMNFQDKEKAKGALLPEKLFGIENVLGVMIGPSFITITKNPDAEWPSVVPAVTETLKSLLSSDKVLFPEQALADEAQPANNAANSEIERKIREVLDNEIRPAVAMDGGDITFYGYEDGVVTLHLQGSCSSCPSSIMTLKMGVENRLKALIPEVREVVQT
jgi:Fe-S cluster biogenesis protein NfuA